MAEVECRTPWKVKLWSKAAAKDAKRRLSSTPGHGGWALEVYRCGGHWHVGHDPVKTRRARNRRGE